MDKFNKFYIISRYDGCIQFGPIYRENGIEPSIKECYDLLDDKIGLRGFYPESIVHVNDDEEDEEDEEGVFNANFYITEGEEVEESDSRLKFYLKQRASE